jgi:hypothetical protein
MSLLDQLREAQAEPARHRTSPFAGPSILTIEQLRAMERVLLREMPGYGPTSVTPPEQHEPHEQRPARAARDDVRPEPEPLALWSPPASVAHPPAAITIDLTDEAPSTVAEPLPVWSAPTVRPAAPPTRDADPAARREPEPCPRCGEGVSIGRIDLTANASWFSCRPCGFRWGGAIERPEAERAANTP